MKPVWNWDDEECVRQVWILFNSGVGLKKIAEKLFRKYEDSPSNNSISSRINSGTLLLLFENIEGVTTEEIEAAVRALHERASHSGESLGPSAPAALRPCRIQIEPEDEVAGMKLHRDIARSAA